MINCYVNVDEIFILFIYIFINLYFMQLQRNFCVTYVVIQTQYEYKHRIKLTRIIPTRVTESKLPFVKIINGSSSVQVVACRGSRPAAWKCTRPVQTGN